MGFPKKISQLPLNLILDNADLFPTVNSKNITSKVTLEQIKEFIGGGSSENTFVTGGTVTEDAQLILVRNDGVDLNIDLGPAFLNTLMGIVNVGEGEGQIFKDKIGNDALLRTISGGTNVNISTIDEKDVILIEVEIPADTNTFITGTSLNNTTYTINQNDGSTFPTDFEPLISGFTTGSTLQQVIENGSVYSGGEIIVMNTAETIILSSNVMNTLVAFGLNNSGTTIMYEDNLNNEKRELSITNNGLLITDEIDLKGVEYASDYSTNFTNESLITKRYVDGVVSGKVDTTLFNTYTANTETEINSKLDITTFDTYTANTTDNVVTGATLVGTTLELERNNGLSDVTVDLSSLSGLTTAFWKSGSTGNFSVAQVTDTTTDATGDYSVAEGMDTFATAEGSHSEGRFTSATGLYSHAEGFSTQANGVNSHAEGSVTRANGNHSHAEGFDTHSDGLESHAGGHSSTASGETSFIHSTDSLVTGDRSVVLGGQNITGTTNDTVYVPFLNVGNLGVGTSLNNLGIDSNGFVVVGATDENVFVNSGNANAASQQLTFTNTSGGTFNVTNGAALFSDNDINVTGGTYNINTGCVSFVTNSGTTFDICGFVTGLTDTFISGSTLVGTDYILNRTDGVNLTTDFNPIVSGKVDTTIFNSYTYTTQTEIDSKLDITTFDAYTANTTDDVVTGATLVGSTLELERNNGLSDVTVDLSSLSFTGNTSGDCITNLWVSNISGCSPVTIGTELVVNEDTSINGHLTVTSSGTSTSDTVFLVQDSLGNHIIDCSDTGKVHVGDLVNSSIPTDPTLLIGAGKTPNDRGSLAFTSSGIGIGGDNDGTRDILLFRVHENIDSQWRFYNQSSFGWILNDRQSNTFGSQSGTRSTISTARSYGMDFMLDINNFGIGVADPCGFRFSSKDSTIAGSNDVERFVIENGSLKTKSYFDNISVLGVGTSNPNTGSTLHVSGDTLINGGLTADTFTISDTPTVNNSGTEILVRNSTSGEVEYREVSTLTGSTDTNTFVSGGTLENGTLTLERNDGIDVTITGFSSGNTIYTTTTNFTATVPQTITHNLDSTNIIVQTIDTNTSELINGTISNYTNNSVDVTLSSSINNIKTVIIGNSNNTTTSQSFSWNDPVVQSGNTSGTCIDQLFIHSISGCSPVLMGDTEFTNEITFLPQTIVDLPTYILTDCNSSINTITTTQNFKEYIGKTITLASEGSTRWSVALQPQYEVTSVSDCCFLNWDIRNCVTGERLDVINYKWDGELYTGGTISIMDTEGCFVVSGTCDEETQEKGPNVNTLYEDCESCTAITYTLISCWDGNDPIYTNTDLSTVVGIGSIKETNSGICYDVFECGEECEPITVVEFESYLEGCESGVCPPNWQLISCGGEILGITTTDMSIYPGGIIFTATNTTQCFSVEEITEAATEGFETLEGIGELLPESCEEYPCINFTIFNCEGLTIGVTDNNLTDYNGGTYSGSTHPDLSGICFTIESGGEEVTIEGSINTEEFVEKDCEECTPPETLYTIFNCEGLTLGITNQDLSLVAGGTYSGTTNPILSGICFTIESGGEEVTIEDIIDTEELIEKDCEECTSEEGTTLTMDGVSQPIDTNFEEAPYSTSDPGEGWGWIVITYSEEGPIGQDVSTVFTTEGFFEGSFPEGLTVFNSAAAIYWPTFGLNNIGDFVPGESYQVNINTNSIINSGAAGLEGFFTF